jgi:hypothetical protein
MYTQLCRPRVYIPLHMLKLEELVFGTLYWATHVNNLRCILASIDTFQSLISKTSWNYLYTRLVPVLNIYRLR